MNKSGLTHGIGSVLLRWGWLVVVARHSLRADRVAVDVVRHGYTGDGSGCPDADFHADTDGHPHTYADIDTDASACCAEANGYASSCPDGHAESDRLDRNGGHDQRGGSERRDREDDGGSAPGAGSGREVRRWADPCLGGIAEVQLLHDSQLAGDDQPVGREWSGSDGGTRLAGTSRTSGLRMGR